MVRYSSAVICPEPEAAKAGGEILSAGGNAVDAALAAAFTQGVVNPLMSGLGGTGRLMSYSAVNQEIKLFDFGTRAGSNAKADIYSEIEPSVFSNRFRVKNWENYIGYKAIVIPSFLQGAWDSHQHSGQIPWAKILQPAIEYAHQGFTIDKYRFSLWDPHRGKKSDSPHPLVTLNATEECASIYLKNGQVYQKGETLKQIDYGATLEKIAEKGADIFYRGEIAEQICKDFEKNVALVTRGDLYNCRTEFKKPVRGQYKNMEIFSEGAPSMGALEILALQMLERIDFKKIGWHTVSYYDVLARVFQKIYGERSKYNADPRFFNVPEDIFVDPQTASKFANEVLNKRMDNFKDEPRESKYTTHVSVVDRWGNAAAITHSNGDSSGVVTPGLGFLFNHHMHNFDPRPGQRDSIAPGKQALFGCSPLIMLDRGKLKLVSGSKSRYRVTAEIQVLIDMFEFEADLAEAIRHFRIHAEYDPKTIYVEPAVPAEIKEGLQQFGWECCEVDMAVPMCTILSLAQGVVNAVADQRGGEGLWLGD